MEEKVPAVYFVINPALEFCAALLILSNADKNMALSEETSTKPDEKLFEIGRFAAGKCSSFLQKEIHFFMDQDNWSLPHISPINSLPFRFALEGSGIRTVKELIRNIESTDGKKLLEAIAGEALANREKTAVDSDAFIERIKNLPPEDIQLREKLSECLVSPVETLHRLSFAMDRFYESVYKHFEEGILSEIGPVKEKYQKLYDTDPAGFMQEYFNLELSNCKNQVKIHVSFFMQAGIISFPESETSQGCFIMGVHSDQRFGSGFTRARLLNFYKLLADEKRLELFELLGQRPWYVNELADHIGLAASTVSHHLSFFIRSGLVESRREEHRQYYSLNRRKVRELLVKSEKMFLKER